MSVCSSEECRQKRIFLYLFPCSLCFVCLSQSSLVVADTEESMMIRGCAVDSGTLTTDTEIIRMSHCGSFYFNDRWNTENMKTNTGTETRLVSSFPLIPRLP